MGQIIGGAAKPKRCNLNQLSQLDTPAAGEHILVSSDNSMNAAGQGNFDCYIVGNGTDAATALPLQYMEDRELDINSANGVSNKAVTAAFKYELYNETNSTYNTTLKRVVSVFPTIGLRKYRVVISDTVSPTGTYLRVMLMDTTNVGYFATSSHIIRNISGTNGTNGTYICNIELSDAEMSSTKSIMVGLWQAQTSPFPECSFHVVVLNNSDISLAGIYEKFPIQINNVGESTIDYLGKYALNDEIVDTYQSDNRVKTIIPLDTTSRKYKFVLKNVSVGNNYLIIKLMNTTNVGYWADAYTVRIIQNFVGADGTYTFELSDAEASSVKGLGVGMTNADASQTPTSFEALLLINDEGSIRDKITEIDNRFPITKEHTADSLMSYLTDMKLYDDTTDAYSTDNRVKVNIPISTYKKYHLSLRELVGVSNINPIVIRLYNTTNVGYWGSAYIVRAITTKYDNTDYDVDIELTDEEFAQVKGIGIGMRDADANHPEFSFRAILYTTEGGVRQQIIENATHFDENEKKIGDLSVLETEDKTSIVGAVNEIMENGIAPHDDIPYNDTIYLASKDAFIRLYNPYKDKGSNVYMGQLHSHKQTMSYANFFAAHKNNGYSFIASIDYDRVRITENNPVAADIPSDFLYLCNGYEANCGAGAGQNGEHMIILNAKSVVGFDELTQMSFPSPKSIADVKSKFVDAGCVVQLAHPYWSTLFQTPEKIATLKSDLRFVEIYSGLNEHNANTEAGYAWDYALDILLSQGNFTFGTAVSDVHAEETSVSSTIIKMGAVKVFANSLTNADVFNALLNGCYYSVSHTTKAISNVSFTNAGVFNVQVGESNALVEFIGKDAEVLATHTTSSTTDTASYQITGNEMYVRARVTYSDGKLAWTQAIFFDKRIL